MRIRALAFGVLVAAPGCPTRGARNPDQSDRHLELAEDYYGKKMRVPALQEALKAIEFDPDNAAAHRLLGFLHLQAADEERLVLEWSQCLEGNAAREQRALVEQKLDDARRHFAAAAEKGAPDSDALNGIAGIELERGRYDEALRRADEALANPLYAGRFAAEANRGRAYYKKGDLARAEVALRRALLEQPSFCLGRYWLAQVYFDKQQCDRVLDEIEDLFAQPRCESQDALHLRGLCQGLLGRRDAARADLDRCVKLAPESCKARECARDLKLVN